MNVGQGLQELDIPAVWTLFSKLVNHVAFVQLFQKHEGQCCVSSEPVRVRCEAFPQRHKTFLLNLLKSQKIHPIDSMKIKWKPEWWAG